MNLHQIPAQCVGGRSTQDLSYYISARYITAEERQFANENIRHIRSVWNVGTPICTVEIGMNQKEIKVQVDIRYAQSPKEQALEDVKGCLQDVYLREQLKGGEQNGTEKKSSDFGTCLD